jgi:DNA (cytosine-5)-methyltransferase 1
MVRCYNVAAWRGVFHRVPLSDEPGAPLERMKSTPADFTHGFSDRRKPRLLDLFCCAGGAGVGYTKAGFEVVGIDLDPQPRYPLPFIRTNALDLDPKFIATFDAIHASPPCQAYSDLAKRNGNAHEWPRLVEPVREMLIKSGLPYVIENVEGAPLLDPVILCGTMFKGLRVLRHRLFEANFPIVPPPHGEHPICHTFDKRKSQFGKTDEMRDFVSVTGGGNCSVAAASDAMGIDWMTKNELNEAIPPVYTRFIGKQMLAHMADRRQSVAGKNGSNRMPKVLMHDRGTEPGVASIAT